MEWCLWLNLSSQRTSLLFHNVGWFWLMEWRFERKGRKRIFIYLGIHKAHTDFGFGFQFVTTDFVLISYPTRISGFVSLLLLLNPHLLGIYHFIRENIRLGIHSCPHYNVMLVWMTGYQLSVPSCVLWFWLWKGFFYKHDIFIFRFLPGLLRIRLIQMQIIECILELCDKLIYCLIFNCSAPECATNWVQWNSYSNGKKCYCSPWSKGSCQV